MPGWGEVYNQIQAQPDPHDRVRSHHLANLSENTGRDVILYSSGWTHLDGHGSTSMDRQDIQGFMQMIHTLEGSELDLILHTPGGSPHSAEKIVGYLRNNYDHIRAFVPQAAMSAGTMVCCAADEIYMGKHSSLGPIDPQFTFNTSLGIRQVPAQAIINQFDRAEEEYKEDSDALAKWAPLMQDYYPGLLEDCEQSINLAEELAEKWAAEYMFSEEDNPEDMAEELANRLTDWDYFKSHSRHIDREDAKEWGFKIEELENDDELQDAILTIYHAATITHENLNIAKIIENQNGGRYMVKAYEENHG